LIASFPKAPLRLPWAMLFCPFGAIQDSRIIEHSLMNYTKQRNTYLCDFSLFPILGYLCDLTFSGKQAIIKN